MKKALPLFAIALILFGVALMRLPDTARNVDTLSLLATGVIIGALITHGVATLRSR